MDDTAKPGDEMYFAIHPPTILDPKHAIAMLTIATQAALRRKLICNLR